MQAFFEKWLGRALAVLIGAGAIASSQAQAADAACETAVLQRDREGAQWDYRTMGAIPGLAEGTGLRAGITLTVPAGVTLPLCDRTGNLIVVQGPSVRTLTVIEEYGAVVPESAIEPPVTKRVPPTRGFKMSRPPSAAATPRPAPKMAPPPPAGVSSARPLPKAAPPPAARTATAQRTVPDYPVWPPETPSSRASLDRFIGSRDNLTLYNAGQKLIRSFEDVGYLEHSFYAAPGGFVLVTRIEKIAEDGKALDGAERYRLPNQRSDPSMTDYIRGLFLDAPPGFYRYIAIVVSNEPYRTSNRRLGDAEAIRRLREGSNDLDRTFRTMPFTEDHQVDALIYEFRKDSSTGATRMIDPGRLPPQTHLARTRLDAAIRKQFAR